VVIKIGFVSSWSDDVIDVVITENYTPSFGDLLYTRERTGDVVRTVVLEVVGLRSEAPSTSAPVEVQGVLGALETWRVARARLFLEILESSSGVILAKASRPPSLMSAVYLARNRDIDSEEIMRKVSEYTSIKGVSVGVLRSGVVHNKALAAERYFTSAQFRLNLREILRKHVLVVGQTGSGKTSGVMGVLVKYALESSERVGWLVIDRHGEYTPPEGYVEGKFIGTYVDAIRINPHLAGTKVYTYRFTTSPQPNRSFSTVPGVFYIREEPVKASSITFSDFAALEGVGYERATLIEEFLTILLDLFKYIEMNQEDVKKRTQMGNIMLDDCFVGTSGDVEGVAGNMIALIPLLADNMVRYEGVGLRREDKAGLHRVLVDAGVDARATRVLRRLVLTVMGWRVKTAAKGRSRVVVLDDSRSVIKVAPVLKDPEKLPCLLKVIADALSALHGVKQGSYPWRDLCTERSLEIRDAQGVDLGEIVRSVDEGHTVILDVSQLSNVQADLVALTVARRLFEHRLDLGVEESSRRPVISIVSEEAPLYLSPERVESPFNPFARIAREGRKFGVGLVAISQMATLIERQLLANFNTLIVMRTRSSSDLNFFRDIGVPVETLPYLGDREAFLYTPDLPIKEPIPVYIQSWFDDEVIKQVRERVERLSREVKVPREILED
jgi:DNA helicase HerA-like ATPase